MSSSEVQQIEKQQKNLRGIPHAPFIADVEKHLGGPDVEVEPTLRQFQDALAKYRYMENNLTQRRQGLEDKIPDIRKTLNIVEFLHERREGKKENNSDDELDEDVEEFSGPLRTTFELNDTLFAEAEIEDTDTIYLWLGANVMLSYTLSDAIELLRSKLSMAETNLKNIISDLEYLREQVTIMEVNTARVFNWDVKRRREAREKEAQKT